MKIVIEKKSTLNYRIEREKPERCNVNQFIIVLFIGRSLRRRRRCCYYCCYCCSCQSEENTIGLNKLLTVSTP